MIFGCCEFQYLRIYCSIGLMKKYFSAICIVYTVNLIGQKVHTPFEQGEIQNNARIGTWTYYDQHAKPGLVIDYNSNSIIHIDADTSAFFVKSEASWKKTKLKSPPRPHYSKLILIQHFQTGMEIFSDFIQKKKAVKAFLTFEVNQAGEATNPTVSSSANTEDERIFIEVGLKKVFQAIPNFWIPGVLPDGSSTTTRLTVCYQVCNTQCEPPPIDQTSASIFYKLDMLLSVSAQNPSGSSKYILQFHENYGLQYGPDDSKLMVSAGIFNYADIYHPIVPNFLSIIDLTSHTQSRIGFGNIIGGSWLPDNSFLFTYSQDNLITGETCIFNTGDHEINPITVASTKSLKLLSPNVLLKYKYKKDTVYADVIHPETDQLIPVGSTVTKMFIPLTWSPDKKYLLVKEQSSDISKTKLVSVVTSEEILIPLINSELCGWSVNGQDLYLLKVVPGYDTPVHNLFRYKIDTRELQEVRLMWKEIDRMKYNAQTDSFLVIRNGKLEVWNPNQGEKTILIDNDVLEAAWSNSGKFLAYITKRDKVISEYSLVTGKEKPIAKWNVKRKELIIE
jgi:hypothetical protein